MSLGRVSGMHPMRPIKGRMLRNFDRPDWGPLVTLAPDRVDEFMWMFEVELENGTRLHAYKHWETRRYLHLDHGGRAFVYIWNEDLAADDDGRYEEVDPAWLLRLVLKEERSAIVLRQNVAGDFRRIRWARSASRHRVARRRTRQVIDRCRLRFTEEPPPDSEAADRRLVFLGDDLHGRPLEVMAIQQEPGSLLIIHAMDLRDKYRLDYEEAARWRS
jgi:hypothetical protein